MITENFYTVKADFFISTDRSKLDLVFIHHYLCNESYWARNIPMEITERSIAGSECFGLYHREKDAPYAYTQVGFARVVTDHATFGYLADVFITGSYRGKGLGKWLMQSIFEHPQLQGFRRWMLATRDAHGLYAQFGFRPLDKPERIMAFRPFEEYPAAH